MMMMIYPAILIIILLLGRAQRATARCTRVSRQACQRKREKDIDVDRDGCYRPANIQMCQTHTGVPASNMRLRQDKAYVSYTAPIRLKEQSERNDNSNDGAETTRQTRRLVSSAAIIVAVQHAAWG